MPAACSMCCRMASVQGSAPKMPARKGSVAEVDAHFRRAVEDVQEVARRATDGGDAEILEDHDLPVGVAAGGRDHGRPQPLAAVVQPQAAGEQPVAVGVLQDVAFVQAEGNQGPLNDLGPDVHVVAVVGDDDRLAGRAAGGVQPDDLVHGAGEEAEGIRVAQVGLHRERQAGDVVDALDALRPQPGLVDPLAVEFACGRTRGEPPRGAFATAIREVAARARSRGCWRGENVRVIVVSFLGQQGRVIILHAISRPI